MTLPIPTVAEFARIPTSHAEPNFRQVLSADKRRFTQMGLSTSDYFLYLRVSGKSADQPCLGAKPSGNTTRTLARPVGHCG